MAVTGKTIIGLETLLPETDPALWEITTAGAGPQGQLPLTEEMLRDCAQRRPVRPDAERRHGLEPGASWAGREFLILSTQGGIRADDGTPIALGYHTGHWEVGLLDAGGGRGAARRSAAIPFAGVLSPIRATAARRARPA